MDCLSHSADQLQPVLHYHREVAHLKWSCGLAGGACTNFDLILGILEERAHDVATPGAVELDHLQLRKDPRPSGNHSLELDQRVKMVLPAWYWYSPQNMLEVRKTQQHGHDLQRR